MNAPVAWRDVTSAARLELRRARDDAWSESTEAPVELAAGPWLVELRGDEVADIRFDGVTLLRGVRAVVRDHDWGTAATVSGAAAHDGDALRLDVRFTAPGIDLVGAVTLEATADSLTIALQATAAAPYRGNRAGLVVLHSPVLAGTALTVVHPDGSSTGTWFPLEIAPHQPARDVAALAWTAGGLALALDLRGEVFEMEDQRNWTDASFKTYSRPLDRPFPYEIPAGGAVRQSITLAVTRRGDSEPPRHPASTPIRLVATGAAFPGIGVGAGPASAAPPQPGPGAPGLAAVLVELDPASTSWRDDLARAAAEAGAAPLDVRLVTDDPTALGEAAAALAGRPVARVGVFSRTTHVTGPTASRLLGEALDAAGVTAERVGGARSHFTELNRGRHDLPRDLDALTVSVTPEMHATDTDQLIESIDMQRLVARQAVALAEESTTTGRVHVGPITLRPRFNAVATSGDGPTDETERLDPATVDHRQTSSALAAWTVSSALALAVPGVASLSFFETTGPRGLLTAAGEPTPAATAVALLAELTGGEVLEPDRPTPAGVRLAGVTTATGLRLVAANLSGVEARLEVVLPEDEDDPRLLVVPAWGVAVG